MAAVQRRFIHWLALVAVAIVSAAGQISAQQSADNAAIIEAVMAAASPQVLQVMPSPSGAVEAVITRYPCAAVGLDSDMAYERLDLRDTATGALTVVTDRLIACGGLGAYGLAITRWTEDERYLYFSDGREGTPDGAAALYEPLWRAAAADGRVEALANGRIAPNGAWVVLWGQDSITLLPLSADLIAGRRFELAPDALSLTELVWLPDSSGVVYFQTDNVNLPLTSAVTLLDVATGVQRVLLGG